MIVSLNLFYTHEDRMHQAERKAEICQEKEKEDNERDLLLLRLTAMMLIFRLINTLAHFAFAFVVNLIVDFDTGIVRRNVADLVSLPNH